MIAAVGGTGTYPEFKNGEEHDVADNFYFYRE
jgi:hypothetical protein